MAGIQAARGGGQDIRHQSYTTLEKDPGRIERRCYTVVDATRVLHDRSGWVDLASLGWVEFERQLLSGPKVGSRTHEVRFFISSLPPQVAPFAHAVRGHCELPWQPP